MTDEPEIMYTSTNRIYHKNDRLQKITQKVGGAKPFLEALECYKFLQKIKNNDK